MLLIWRAEDVKPLGPVQLHVPVRGCGPRYTAVVVELTVAADSSVHVEPPFTEMYGTIAVGVQLELPVTVSAMVVVALRLPEVPVMVTVEVPAVAVELAVRVSTLLPVVGLVPNTAPTPLGSPDAARVTLPSNGLTSVTVIVSVPLAPWATDKLDAAGLSVKLPVPPVPLDETRIPYSVYAGTVTVNVPPSPLIVLS
jgi:hypothetical protein